MSAPESRAEPPRGSALLVDGSYMRDKSRGRRLIGQAGFVIGLTECHGVKVEEIVNIWNAYIDESGIHRESSNIVVAATLASGKTWQELVPEWKTVLDHYGLSHFHAVDFNCGTGECANMTREERVDCVKRLVQVAGDASLEYIAYAIKRDLYESRDTDLVSCQVSNVG